VELEPARLHSHKQRESAWEILVIIIIIPEYNAGNIFGACYLTARMILEKDMMSQINLLVFITGLLYLAFY